MALAGQNNLVCTCLKDAFKVASVNDCREVHITTRLTIYIALSVSTHTINI